MNEPHELPVIFAVTGHRDIRPEDEPAIRASVRGIFERFRVQYPCTPLVLLTPLAAGADRIVARVALDLRVPLRVPMPLPEAEYRKDFDGAENAEFSEMLALAEEASTMPFVGDNTAENVSEQPRRDRQYAMVGAYIARISHVFLALWNGKPSSSAGGTGDIVRFRLEGAPEPYRNPTALLDAPDTGPVYHIVTPRRSDPETDAPAGTLVLRTSLGTIDERDDPLRPLYARIDRFNRDQRRLKLTPADASLGLRDIAERLATRYQGRYRRALDLMFAATTVGALALALSHHDHPLYLAVLIDCVVVAIAYAVHAIAEERQWKERSIEYRALELALRIQRVWDLIDLRASVADYYLRIQRSEFDWIREAVRTVHHLAEKTSDTALGIAAVREFVVSQRKFFSVAAPRDERYAIRFEAITGVFFWSGLILTLILFAVAFGNFVSPATPSFFPPAVAFVWERGELFIVGIAVATILAAVSHEYSRRHAFESQSRRYATMLQMYERALDLLDEASHAPFEEQLHVSREVIREAGREALAENGEWLMMHRELPIGPLHV